MVNRQWGRPDDRYFFDPNLIAEEKAHAKVLLEWSTEAKESADQSNSSDILITTENQEEFLLYEGLTITGTSQPLSLAKGSKEAPKNKGSPSASKGREKK